MDLTDIYRTFHSRATAFTFLSGAYEIFSKIYHILSHKSSLNKFNNTEIIPVVFFHYNGMKLGINSRRKTGNTQVCGN